MLQHLLLEDFITGFHIREVKVCAEVGEESQELVAQSMPEHQHTPWGAEESRPVDDIGCSVENRFNQLRIFPGMVLQIGILDDDDLARGFLESGAQRCPLSHILGLIADANLVLRFFSPLRFPSF